MSSEDKVFNLLLHQKDADSSDLNEKFDSYKCHTLEAKVPVVEAGTSTRLQGSSKNVQLLNTLKLKARGVTSTKNARLKMLTINDNIVIEATPQEEREEVSRPELDAEIDEYMVEARKIKLNRMRANNESMGVVQTYNEVIDGLDSGSVSTSRNTPSSSMKNCQWSNKKGRSNDQNKDPGSISQIDLDEELDEYMRQKSLKKKPTTESMDVD